MKLTKPLSIALFALVLLTPEAHAATGGFLDSIQSQFQNATDGWMTQALVYAKNLFMGLAGIEFVWWGITRVLRGGEVHELATGVLLKALSLGFFLVLLVEAPTWIPDIIDSFEKAGKSVGAAGSYGVTQLNPGAVFDQGFNIANAMYEILGNQHYGMMHIANAVSADITVLMAALLAIIAFGLIALQLLITTIESYIIIGGGALMLGFGGSRWTLPFAEKYIGYAVSVGVKLFILYLIVGLATHIGNQAISTIHHSSSSAFSPMLFLQMGTMSVIVAGVAWMVPSLAGSLMNGSPSMGVGALGSAVSGIVGGTIAGGAAGAATALKTANATIGASKFMGGVTSLARSGGLGFAASGAGNALGSAARDAFHGIGFRRNQQIASALGSNAVQGMGEGTVGGSLANRVRAFSGTTPRSASGNKGNAIEGAGVKSVGSGMNPKGTHDGFSGGSNTGNFLNPRDADPNKAQAALNNAAKQRSHMPYQGQAGGISIRFKHQED